MAPLVCATTALGKEAVMFAADYPFEIATEASEFIDLADISDATRQQVCWGNAARIFNIK